MQPARTVRTLVPMLVVALLASATTLGLVRLTTSAMRTAQASGQETVPLVRAQRFDLVDGDGRLRGSIAFNAAGQPVVALLDEAGRVRIAMRQNPEGQYGFSVTDAQGTLRFAVGTTARGFVGLNVRDGSGTIRANLFATDDGTAAAVQTWDEAGRVRTFMGGCPTVPSGFHAFDTFDSEGPFDPCPGP